MVRAAVTSCRVCNDGNPPLWQIRARRVIHDGEERQLYFYDAQFLVGDMALATLPRLRLPDPTLNRARGFLIPTARSSSLLGTGIKVPYFIPLGRSRDLTLTPYLSTQTRTLELRYRQAFRRGFMEFNSAVSEDSLIGPARAYLFGEGMFELPRDFTLTFDLKTTSDDAYLSIYDYSDLDRLDSSIEAQRIKRDQAVVIGLYHFHSLRQDEDNSTLPSIIGSAQLERRYFPRSLGGEVRVNLAAHSHYRISTLNIDGADTDTIVDGRDVLRGTAELSWHRIGP